MHATGVRARVIEIKLDEEKLKLGLKESYFVDVEDEIQAERLEAAEDADLDEEMLDAAEVDSDEDDWRNSALGPPMESADEGKSEVRRRELPLLLSLLCSASKSFFVLKQSLEAKMKHERLRLIVSCLRTKPAT